MQKIIAFFLFYFIVCNISFAQFLKSTKKRVDFFSFIENTNNLLPPCLFNIDISVLKKKCSDKGLNIFLPDSCYLKSSNGKDIIVAFLYNNSLDTILTSDCDGMVMKSALEVKQNDKWIVYHKSEDIECWVDCVQQYLFPGQYSVLAIFSEKKGTDKIPLRIKMKTDHGEYLSNVVTGLF